MGKLADAGAYGKENAVHYTAKRQCVRHGQHGTTVKQNEIVDFPRRPPRTVALPAAQEPDLHEMRLRRWASLTALRRDRRGRFRPRRTVKNLRQTRSSRRPKNVVDPRPPAVAIH